MMKFYLFLQNFSEQQIHFLSFPWEIVFGVILGKYSYILCKNDCKILKMILVLIFVHQKLKLLDFL